MNPELLHMWPVAFNAPAGHKLRNGRYHETGRTAKDWKLFLARHQQTCPQAKQGKECAACREMRAKLAEERGQ